MSYTKISTRALLSLFKRRAYRFSKDWYMHVLAECLEKQYTMGKVLKEKSRKELSTYLESISKGESYSMPVQKIAQDEGLDLEKELNSRFSFVSKNRTILKLPKKVVHIIGSPRSGTSILFNLLAYCGQFAYFSSISHLKWSLYNYHHSTMDLLHQAPSTILTLDSKTLKVNSEVILPSEAEDIFNTCMPCYEHIKGHAYFLKKTRVTDSALFQEIVSDHLASQQSDFFLTKSPFNSFRIEELKQIYPNTYFIHIYRNGYATTHSIANNHFKYFSEKQKEDNPIAFWKLHINTILSSAPKATTFSLSLEELVDAPFQCVKKMLSWLDIPPRNLLPKNFQLAPLAQPPFTPPTLTIEELNQKLGYGSITS